MNTLHEVRAQILYTLRHSPQARFNQLMKQSSLESDSFKFHVRALVAQGYIEKVAPGTYTLTAKGKEVANNLDERRTQTLKQSKLSLMVIISRHTPEGQTQFLMQQRLRQPFYGYWGFLSGPAQWGEDFCQTARHEVAKQTGITDIDCSVRCFYRQSDHAQDGTLLEDKLFIVVTATATPTATPSPWAYGTNRWMTASDCQSQENVFGASTAVLEMLQQDGQPPAFTTGFTTYSGGY